jgi:hypothetical protein
MNIFTGQGSRVRFSHPDYGYPADQERAKRYLVVGEIYTVNEVYAGSFSTTVFLREVPYIGFNSVLFDDVEE